MVTAHRPHTDAAPAQRWRVTRVCARLAALAAAWAALSGTAEAGVTVRDEVGAAGIPLILAVRTTGRFLPAGGRLVDLFLEGRPLARVLTGGDGWGYHRFTPPAPGLFALQAASEGEEGSGRLLVAAPTDKVVLVETAAALGLDRLDRRWRNEGTAVLRDLAQRYRLVYLAGRLGGGTAREWLAAGDAPASVWLEGAPEILLDRLAARRVPVWGVIGSPALARAAASVPVQLTFEAGPAGTRLRHWSEVPLHLEKGAPP